MNLANCILQHHEGQREEQVLAEQGASKQKAATYSASDFLMGDPGPSWTGLPLLSTAGWAACHTARRIIYSQQLVLD